MSFSKTALIVVRIINGLTQQSGNLADKFGEFAMQTNLTDGDLKAVGDVLVAISLMTNANVAAVRDPSLYDPVKAGRLRDAMSKHLLELGHDHLGLDVTATVTKKQYEIANKIFMDTKDSVITNKDLQDFAGKMPLDMNSLELSMDVGKAVKSDVRPDILYRGLKNMSYESWQFLVDDQHEGRNFDIGKGIVSFSRERSAAEDFMSGKNPILMIMKNPKKKGIPAEKLSYWPTEWETIITEGKISIDSYKMIGTCLIRVNHDEYNAENALYTISSDDEITIERRGSNSPLTAQTPTSNEEGGAVDGRWFVKNIVSKAGKSGISGVIVPLFDAKQNWDKDYWAEVLSVKTDWRLIVQCTLL